MALEFYSARDTVLHRLSSPSKIIFLVCTSLIALIVQSPEINAAILAILAIMAIYVRVPRNVVALFLRTAIVVAIAITISWLFFSKVGVPVFHIYGGFYIYSMSELLILSAVFRLWTLIASTMVFLSITREGEFISGLRKLKMPFSASLMLALVLRFIPLLYQEATQIREAQMARGLELEKISLFQRVKKFVVIMIPWLVISMKMVSSLTMAISSRGFEIGGRKRTFFREPRLRSYDYTFIVVLVGLTVAFTVLRLEGHLVTLQGSF